MLRLTNLFVFGVLFLIALVEVGADLYQQSRVADRDAWLTLAKHVEANWQDGDVVVAGTDWAEPLVRTFLGDRIPHRVAGRSDLLGYRRAWVVSVHEDASLPGHDAIPTSELASFGSLSLGLARLPADETLVVDLVEAFAQASVQLGEEGPACTIQRGVASGGGLGRGPMRPALSWRCPNGRAWIGRTTIEDLNYHPRRCIWQQALIRNPTRITYDTIGPAERLVVHAGHYLRDERKQDGPPVVLNVYVDGVLAGQMTHRDGDGWKRFELDLPQERPVSVSFEPVASERAQNFCWAAKALRRAQ